MQSIIKSTIYVTGGSAAGTAQKGGSVSGADVTAKSAGGAVSETGAAGNVNTKGSYYNPGKEISKLERKLERTEEKISELEEKIQNLKDELVNPAISSNFEELSRIQAEIDENEMLLLDAMEEWSDIDKNLSKLRE